MTYPSNRTVSYSYNSAGQMSGFTGNLGGGSAVSYATDMQYNARADDPRAVRDDAGAVSAKALQPARAAF